MSLAGRVILVALLGSVVGLTAQFSPALAAPTAISAGVVPTSVPTPTVTYTCPPVMPTVTLQSATTTTLTFDYTWACAIPLRFTLYSDAQGQHVVAEAARPDGPLSGRVTFSDLTPGTTYYFSYTTGPYSTGGTGYTSPIYGPVSTLSTEVEAPCTAALTVLSQRDGGFTASLLISNPDSSATLAWKVSWTWTGGQTLSQAYSALVAGTPANPELTGASWNRQLAPGESTTVFLIGRGQLTSTPPLTCAAL